MSRWSSFEDDKRLSDTWKTFSFAPVEEGLFDTLKSMTGASNSLEQLLATQTIEDYFKVYVQMLKMWVTSHKNDPSLKASVEDYIDNFDDAVAHLMRDPDLETRVGRSAIQSIADFGDKQFRSRGHLRDLIKKDPRTQQAATQRQQPVDTDGDGQPDPPDVDRDGDGQPDPQPTDVDGDGEADTAQQGAPSEQLVFRLRPLAQKLKQAGIPSAAIVTIMKSLKQQLAANNVPVKMQENIDVLIHHLLAEMQNSEVVDEQKKKKKPKKKRRKQKSKKSSVSASEKARRIAQSAADKQRNQQRAQTKKAAKPSADTTSAVDSDTSPQKDNFYKRKAAGQTTQAIPPGLKPEAGTIKIKPFIAHLRTIDPNLNRKSRKKAIAIVRKHLLPYVEKYNLKLAEHQIDLLSNRLAEELQKLGLLL